LSPSGEKPFLFPGRKLLQLLVELFFGLLQKGENLSGKKLELRSQGFPKTLLQKAFLLLEGGKGEQPQNYPGNKHQEYVEKGDPRIFGKRNSVFAEKEPSKLQGKSLLSKGKGVSCKKISSYVQAYRESAKKGMKRVTKVSRILESQVETVGFFEKNLKLSKKTGKNLRLWCYFFWMIECERNAEKALLYCRKSEKASFFKA